MTRPTADTALIPADFEPRPRTEQRREPRYPHARTIEILPIGQMTFVGAQLLDCSRHGLGLITENALVPGDEFLVRLRARRTVLLLYAVRYCAEENGKYHIGAEFADLCAGPFETDPQRVLDALLSKDVPCESAPVESAPPVPDSSVDKSCRADR